LVVSQHWHNNRVVFACLAARYDHDCVHYMGTTVESGLAALKQFQHSLAASATQYMALNKDGPNLPVALKKPQGPTTVEFQTDIPKEKRLTKNEIRYVENERNLTKSAENSMPVPVPVPVRL